MSRRSVNLEVKLRKGESSTGLIKRFIKQSKKFGHDGINLGRHLQEASAMSRRYKKPSKIKQEKKRARDKVIARLKREEKYNG